MNNERPEYLRLIPIGIKAVKIGVEDREYEIYENNPYTNEKGTLVPTDDAIALISRSPDLVGGAFEVVNGEAVSAIPDDIWLEINRKKQELIALSGTHRAPNKSNTRVPTTDNTLAEVLRSQSAIMESQNKQMEAIMTQMAEMQKMMSAMMDTKKKK